MENITKEFDKVMEVGKGVHEQLQDGTLTEDQVEEIVENLSENIGPQSQKLREIKKEINDMEYPHHVMNRGTVVKGAAPITYDSDTGETRILEDETKQPVKASLSDIIDGSDEIKIAEASKETMVAGLKELGLDDEVEVLNFVSVLERHKSGEKISYSELPKMAKQMIDGLNGFQKVQVKQSMVNSILDYFINELNLDQEFIDFQASLKEELDIPGMADLYSEHLRETMEVKVLETADKIENESPEKAKSLREISKAYTDSYTFAQIKHVIENEGKEAKRLDKEISKYNRYCREFNFKYQKSKFMINDVNLVLQTLKRQLPEFTEDTLKKFVVLFCRITRDMSADNPVEHSYMYYTIKTILSLDYIEKDTTFRDSVLDNLREVLNLL